MKTIITKQSRPKLLLLSAFIITVLLFSACKVTFVPSYDSKLVEQTQQVSKSIDKLYFTMLEANETDGGRAYSKYADRYIDIEVELQSILYKNEVREKNNKTVAICDSTIRMFRKHKEEHKTNKNQTLSDKRIKSHQETIQEMLVLLVKAEEGKKIAEIKKTVK